MATKISTTLVDDFDPDDIADETVTFALDGTSYEIDLTTERARALRSAIDFFASHARVTSRTATSTAKRRSRANATEYDPAKVREWAKTQGIELSERGRISANVIQAYKIGHLL